MSSVCYSAVIMVMEYTDNWKVAKIGNRFS